MTAVVLRGDAARLPLPDASADLIVTSPPYFALRSYADGGQHYDGQIGSEATPREYLEALWACTAEWIRVLKPAGSLFVNLGDKYATRYSSIRGGGRAGLNDDDDSRGRSGQNRTGIGEKSLLGLPWRYALGCTDRLGLILRAEIIWDKPNGLPESVTDRVRRSHEQVFHFTLRPRYYSAVDEVREPHVYGIPNSPGRIKSPYGQGFTRRAPETDYRDERDHHAANPLGRLPGSVWAIREDESLIRSILRAVADGALTPEEGERLWTGRSESGRLSTRPARPAAGTGPAVSTTRDTGFSGYQDPSATSEPTGSCTSSSSDPSPKGSPSTTSAATSDASIPRTSSPSPSTKTSGAGHSHRPASTDTTSRLETPMSEPGEAANAASACDDGSAPTMPGTVWRIPSSPLTVPARLGVDHFAAYPPELVRRIVLGWSPPGVCTACGEGRRPVIDSTIQRRNSTTHAKSRAGERLHPGNMTQHTEVVGWKLTTITGYACACPVPDAPARPAVVVDPFGGTGTTALVASVHGRIGVTVDRSGDYCRLARWRTRDPGERARALNVPKPPPVPEGQGSLFDEAIA